MRARKTILDDGARVDVKILEVVLDIRGLLEKKPPTIKKGSRVIPKNPK